MSNRNSSEGLTGSIRIYHILYHRYSQFQFTDSSDRRYSLNDFVESRDASKIYVEYQMGIWSITTAYDNILFTSERNPAKKIILHNHEKVYLLLDGGWTTLFPEKISRENETLYNYQITGNDEIRIGRAQENDIICMNSNISRIHAVLMFRNGRLYIRDENSSNGTYVNRKRISEHILELGDVIYIFGLKIIIGAGFLSVNSGNGDCILGKRLMRLKYSNFPSGNRAKSVTAPERSFSRYPREQKKLEQIDIVIEDPPLSLNSNQAPMLLRMGSSVVMGGSAALRGSYTSLLTMLLFPILNNAYSDKEKQKYEGLRVSKYTEYLRKMQNEIIKEKCKEENFLNHYYPALDEVIEFTESKERLWERSFRDNDFLNIRIGAGSLPIKANILYNEQKFSLEEDPLEDQKLKMVHEDYHLRNVPVLLNLTRSYICGVAGSRDLKERMFIHMIMQLCISHSYDEVKIVLLLDRELLDKYSFLKYLPHVWNEDKSFRYLATDLPSSYLIGERLGKVIELCDNTPALEDILKKRAYYVFFAFNKQLLDSIEFMKNVIQSENNNGVSVVTFFDDVLRTTKQMLRLNKDNRHKITYMREANDEAEEFFFDYVNREHAINRMYSLGNITLGKNKESYVLPKMITFLEMFGVGRIEHLNLMQRWRNNNPIKSLAVPVGVTTDGSLFMLDLHEKYQGPHGLVAGMTGSGKSEFLITYILSLAVNFHPDEVAFLLIDYKGGGLAGAFENEEKNIHLPHLVGTITNLDGGSITRALLSIESELKRRQRIFRETKMANDEGTMDIYLYQKLYRSGKVKQPLPHLFIISDEFAELKSQEPEFMDQLISAARIGRSLGIHLILATQKPAGVVNDQISSNSKFRVCLKVQTRADSDEMLRRPEAAEIKETGRFYLQVGYNEFFALGQSAWCGAAYEPQDQVIEHRDDYVQFIDDAGQTIVQAKPLVQKELATSSQIVSIVKYLSNLAEKEHIVTNRLWLPPLEKEYDIRKLQKDVLCPEGRLPITFGIIDNPKEQQQYPYVLDIAKCQNILITGGSQSGKTTALQSILYALILNFSPEEVNYYILDFGGGQLKVFDHRKYCGGVWEDGEEEKISKFFDLLKEVVSDRKQVFKAAGVGGYDAYCEIGKMPMILVAIDQISGLSTWKKGKDIVYELNKIIQDCNAAGIKFVITSSSYDDVPYNIKKELRTRIVLEAKNRFEYGDILGVYCKYEPSKAPGRCFVRMGEEAFECQLGRFSAEGTEYQRMKQLKESIEVIAMNYSHLPMVKSIRTISEEETYADFCTQFQLKRIPLGYSVKDAKTISIPLKQLYCASLYFGNPKHDERIVRNYLYAASRNHAEFIIIQKKTNSIFASTAVKDLLLTSKVSWYMDDLQSLISLTSQMNTIVKERLKLRNEYCADHMLDSGDRNNAASAFEYIYQHSKPVFIIFEDFIRCCQTFTENEKLVKFYANIFKDGIFCNFYFLGCNYPEAPYSIEQNPAYAAFCSHGFALLYGGQYDKQRICSLPMEYRSITQILKKPGANIMLYHSQFHQLWMPTYQQITAEVDLDDEEII